jgi:ABC-type transport system substrate-binding protein
VTLRRIAEPSARTAALSSGQVQMSWNVSPSQVPLLKQQPGVKVVVNPTFNMEFLEMNVTKPPFNNLKVRQAMNYAINAKEIGDVAYEGFRVPFDGPVPPVMHKPAATLQRYEYDPNKAKQLLKEAGYETLETSMTYENDADKERMAQLVQSQLAKVGVTLKLVRMERAAFSDGQAKGEFELTASAYGNSRAEPSYTLKAKLSDPGVSSNNYGHYSSPEMDKVLNQLTTTFDEAERNKLIERIFEVYQQDVPWAAPVQKIVAYAMLDKVQGFVPHPASFMFLGKVSVAP